MLPRWMKWLFVGFLAYLVFVGSRLPQTAQPVQPVQPAMEMPAITRKDYPVLANALDMDHWRRGINPDAVAQDHCGFDNVPRPAQLGMKVIDDTAGSGNGAACGETVSLHLTVWGTGGTPAYTGNKVLTLGAGEITHGLDAGLVGIRPGGTRTLVLPPAALRRAKTARAPDALLAALPGNRLAIVTVERLK